MPSGAFSTLPVSSIRVGREDRQRRELKGIPALADSIKRLGLIHPIVVRSETDPTLVAGERRLEAHKLLGRETIAVQFANTMDWGELHSIELEENVKREDVSWQDTCKAIQDYHEYRRQLDPQWNAEKTAEALGFSPNNISERLAVAAKLGDEKIASQPSYTTARGIVQRSESRKNEEAVNELLSSIGSAPRPPSERIICADFNEWAKTYSGPKFNLIHCDFPYGIDTDKRQQGNATQIAGAYADSEDVYWRLCHTLRDNLPRIASGSCHLVFWFSMKFYEETFRFLNEETPFVIDEFPLIWYKSDGAGMLPRPNHGPRRVYETAFFGWSGDRHIVQAKANAFSAPTVANSHLSAKPQPMLEHFFSMLVDENSRVLDPTCGSGAAIRAALKKGAKHVLGLEINPEYAKRAAQSLED